MAVGNTAGGLQTEDAAWAPADQGLRYGSRAIWIAAAITLAFYTLWVVVYLAAGHDIRDFIVIGRTSVLRSHTSAVIRFDPAYHYRDPLGYDGQYAYFLALDPLHARFYMDYPSYRYTRILYPMLARLLAWGSPALIPYTLVTINVLAVAGGVAALGVWLRRRNISPWLSLIYAFSPGIFLALNGDLNEPLAYTLVIVGLVLLDGQRRWSVPAAAGAFALAALTRETTAVFPAIIAVATLVSDLTRATWRKTLARNWRRSAWLAASALPLVAYKIALTLWLGAVGYPAQVQFSLMPFGGLLSYWPWHAYQYIEVESVVVPALICAALAIVALRRTDHRRDAALWLLLVNVALFVVFLPASSYVDQFASTRIATGVLLGALLSIPALDALTRGRRIWLAVCAVLWLAILPPQALGMLHLL